MTKDEVIALLQSRTDIPGNAEFRITKPLDTENSVNAPATDVAYHEIGPIKYAEII